MEVDVSLIIGYVMKFNYVLPYNASYLTDSYVRYDRSINRGVEVDGDDEPSPDHEGTRPPLIHGDTLPAFFSNQRFDRLDLISFFLVVCHLEMGWKLKEKRRFRNNYDVYDEVLGILSR